MKNLVFVFVLAAIAQIGTADFYELFASHNYSTIRSLTEQNISDDCKQAWNTFCNEHLRFKSGPIDEDVIFFGHCDRYFDKNTEPVPRDKHIVLGLMRYACSKMTPTIVDCKKTCAQCMVEREDDNNDEEILTLTCATYYTPELNCPNKENKFSWSLQVLYTFLNECLKRDVTGGGDIPPPVPLNSAFKKYEDFQKNSFEDKIENYFGVERMRTECKIPQNVEFSGEFCDMKDDNNAKHVAQYACWKYCQTHCQSDSSSVNTVHCRDKQGDEQQEEDTELKDLIVECQCFGTKCPKPVCAKTWEQIEQAFLHDCTLMDEEKCEKLMKGVYHHGTCYTVHQEEQPLDIATESCSTNKYHQGVLATIQEEKLIRSLTSRTELKCVWTGLRQLGREWYWMDDGGMIMGHRAQCTAVFWKDEEFCEKDKDYKDADGNELLASEALHRFHGRINRCACLNAHSPRGYTDKNLADGTSIQCDSARPYVCMYGPDKLPEFVHNQEFDANKVPKRFIPSFVLKEGVTSPDICIPECKARPLCKSFTYNPGFKSCKFWERLLTELDMEDSTAMDEPLNLNEHYEHCWPGEDDLCEPV